MYHSAVRTLRATFVATAIAWAALLVVVPFLASLAHASMLASALIVAVYGIGSLVCHQLPERSYHLWGAQMPVCARCAGIYAGAVAGAITSALRTTEAARHNRWRVAQSLSTAPRVAPGLGAAPNAAHGQSTAPRVAHDLGTAPKVAQGPAGGARVALALAVTPSVLTLLYEWTTGVMPAHAIRFAAGLPIGLVAAWLVVTAADNQVN